MQNSKLVQYPKIQMDGAQLKPLELDHADEMFALIDRNRFYLREHLPWLDISRSAEDSRGYIQMTLEQRKASVALVTGIWWNGKFAGTIGTHPIDWKNQKASLGYWISEDLQGKGLITSACRAFLKYLFEIAQLNRVEIYCGTTNEKSQAVPKRLGMKHEGTLRESENLYGRYVDHHLYAMTASDYRTK
ncbi:MAG: GNAT family N-acetyltransferase [Bdellovibrionales bacterium]|nr:GNAT family N-acetyltransferase [Bdellovibrionales bacterium]